MTSFQPEKEKRALAVTKKRLRKLIKKITTEVWEIKEGGKTYIEDKTRTVDFNEDEEGPRMGFGEK